MIRRLAACFRDATFLRFVVVGGSTALLYMAFLYLFFDLCAFPSELSVLLAYPGAVVFNYCAHYWWTFRSDMPQRQSIPRYLVITVLFYGLNLLAMKVVRTWVDIDFLLFQMVFAATFAIGTFLCHRIWVFCRLER